MVIDAILLSTPKDTRLIMACAALELAYDPQRAFSEYFQLGAGNASDYLLYGRVLFKENDDGKAAIAALSHARAICEPSEKFEILVDLACCKEYIGDRQGALTDFSEAEILGQLDARTLTFLAELHAKNGDAAAAIAAWDRAALIEPPSVSIIEQRAACKYAVGDYSGAKADLNAIISLGVNHSVTYKARGLANMQLGRFEAALADLNQAVAQQSDRVCHYAALVSRAVLHHRMDNLQDAVADLDTAHQVQPLTDSDQARRQQYLQQLIEISPATTQTTDATNALSDADALYRQADVRRGKGDLAGAASALQEAAKLQPQDVRLYHECAHVHMRMFNYTEALQQLQTLIALDSTWDVINVLRMCSVCKNKLGRHVEALADLNKAVEVDPCDVRVLLERAVTKTALLDYNGALADANTAIQLYPHNAAPLMCRGHILYMMGQLEAALVDLDKADEMCPNQDIMLIWRGHVKHDLED